MRRVRLFRLLILTCVLSPALTSAVQQPGKPPARPAKTTIAGELVVEPPTLINLGFEWFIQGDANRDAAVRVTFTKRGETTSREALLLRLQGERIYAESRVDLIAPNMFAGSVLDLEPGTT